MPSEPSSAARPGFAGRAGCLATYFADPWFDGANYRATIVVSPHRGSIVPAGHASDLTDDAVVGVVVQELELCAYLGPASLFDYSLVNPGQSVPGGEGVTSTRREAEVIQTTVKVEDAPLCELLPEHYRFGKVQLGDRQNLNNRRFAEQIGCQLWPFLEPSGVQTCPSDFVARHLIAAPLCVTV